MSQAVKKHAGMFTKDDPRIHRGGRKRVEVIRGMTITEIAQTKGPECMDLLGAVIAGVSELDPNEPCDYPLNQRIRAVELVLGYAYGKPVNTMQLQEINRGQVSGLQSLSTAELLSMIETAEDAEIAPANAHTMADTP